MDNTLCITASRHETAGTSTADAKQQSRQAAKHSSYSVQHTSGYIEVP